MLLSAVSFLVVAQSSLEVPKGLMNNPVYMYEGNSKSKVPYFIPAEWIAALSWQAWVLLVHMFTTI